MPRSFILVLLFLGPLWSLMPQRAQAHHFWMEPVVSSSGDSVLVEFRVGERLPGEPTTPDPERVRRFDAIQSSGVTPLGTEALGGVFSHFRKGAGAALVVYESRPSAIYLPSQGFRRYLQEEGLDSITGALPLEAPGFRENFSRCAKALLPGEDMHALLSRVVGLPFELTAQWAPSADSSHLVVKTHRAGSKVENVLVRAVAPSGRMLEQRSNPEGETMFSIDEPGRWLLAAVHMEPLAREDEADYRSWWASLTFERAEG